jgi:hypothetical protein
MLMNVSIFPDVFMIEISDKFIDRSLVTCKVPFPPNCLFFMDYLRVCLLIRIEDAVNQVISRFKLHPGLFQILPYNYMVGYLLSNQWEGIYLKVAVFVPTSGNIRVLDGCVISTLMFSGCHH